MSRDVLPSSFRSARKSRSINQKGQLRIAAAVVPLAAALIGGAPATADPLFFDGDGIGPANGGSGQWDYSLIRWSTTPGGPVNQFFNDGMDVNFIGPGGTVYVPNGASINALTISGGNYFFRGSPVSFNPNNQTVTVNVAAGSDAQFQPAVAGSSGFVKTGAGSIGFFSNVVTGGLVDIQQGTVYFANPNGELTDATVVNVGAQGTLDLRRYNESSFGGVTGSGLVLLGATPGYVAQTTGSLFGITYNDTSTTQEFSGSIQGYGGIPAVGGRVVKQGLGTVRFSGNNNYGVTGVRGGTLEITGGKALPDFSPVNFNNSSNGATLRILSSETTGSIGGGGDLSGIIDLGTAGNVTLTIGNDGYTDVYRGALQGTGTIVKVGGGIQSFNVSTNLASVSTYTGNFRIEGGTLAFNNEGAMGQVPGAAMPGNITLAGGTFANSTQGGFSLNANRGISVVADSGIRVVGSGVSTLTVNGTITGTSGLTKSGPGILDIGSDPGVTYSGKWTVTEGTLRSSRGIAIPLGTGSIDLSGGAVQLKPGSTGLTIAQTIASAPGSTFSYGPASTLRVERGANTSYTLTVGNAGANSFQRNTNGTLVLVAPSGINNLGNPLTGEQVLVGGGGINTTASNGIVPGVFGVGDHLANQVGDFLGYNVAAGFQKATYTSADLASATAASVVEQASDVTLTAPGKAYALKVGAGSPVNVNANGQTLTVGSGMVILNDGSAINGGTIALGSTQGVFQTPGDNATLGASVTGTGAFTKLGEGTLTLASGATLANTGPTIIGQGTLAVSANNQLSSNADLVMFGGGAYGTVNTTGTFSKLKLNGTTQTVRSLSSGNNAAYLRSSTGNDYGPLIDFGTDGKLIVGSGDSTYKGGAITDTGSTASTLWKNGTGALTLGESVSPDNTDIPSAAMSYNKLWVSGGGVVSLASGNSIPNNPAVLTPDTYNLDGGTLRVTSLNVPNLVGAGGVASTFLDITGNRRGITIGANGGTIEVTNPLEIVLANAGSNNLYGTGTLVKTGPGILRPSTNNPGFSGKTLIKQGPIQITGELSLGVGSGNDYITVDGGTLAIESNSITTWDPSRGVTVTANGAEIRNSVTWVFAGQLSGSGAITKTGGGTWIVTNPLNSGYTGNITAINGVLDVRADGALGSGKLTFDPQFPVSLLRASGTDPITLPNAIEFKTGSTIDIRPSAPIILSGKVGGSGNVFKGLGLTGTSSLTFSNPANDFTGNITATTGTLIAAANGAMGSTSGATIVQGSGTFALQGPAGGSLNYTVPEPVSLLGDGANGVGALQNIQGVNTFAGPIALAAPTSIGVTADSLELTGRITGGGDSFLRKRGDGTLILSNASNAINADFTVESGPVAFNANQTLGGQLILQSNTSATLAPGNHVLRTTNVQFNDSNNPDAKLDLNNGRLIVDYADGGSSPLTSVRSAIVAAYAPNNSPHWTGNGITSATAAAKGNQGVGYAEASEVSAGGKWTGETVDGSAVVVRLTLLGDATLDGTVDFNDLVKLAQNYNTTVSATTESWWTHGDFTYDGVTDFNDLVKLAQNYNTSLPAAGSIPGASPIFEADLARAFASVPEPGTLGALSLIATAGMFRRRRRSCKV